MAQLDGEGRVAQALLGLHDLVPRLVGGEEPARVLEEDGAELAGAAQRLDAVEEAVPDLVLDLCGQVAGVDALLVEQLRRQRLAQVLRQPLDLRRLAGHERVGLDVEREVRRRALQPQLAGAPRRQGVVRRVHLDERELVRVVDEPILGAAGVGRVEDAGRGHRRDRSTTRCRCGRWPHRASAAPGRRWRAPRRAAPADSGPGSWTLASFIGPCVGPIPDAEVSGTSRRSCALRLAECAPDRVRRQDEHDERRQREADKEERVPVGDEDRDAGADRRARPGGCAASVHAPGARGGGRRATRRRRGSRGGMRRRPRSGSPSLRSRVAAELLDAAGQQAQEDRRDRAAPRPRAGAGARRRPSVGSEVVAVVTAFMWIVRQRTSSGRRSRAASIAPCASSSARSRISGGSRISSAPPRASEPTGDLLGPVDVDRGA